MAPLTIADHILFSLIAFVLPVLLIWRQQPAQMRIPQDSTLKIKIYWLNCMVLWVGALVVVALWYFSGRSFVEMGIRLPDPASFPHWMLLIAGFTLFYLVDVVMSWNSDDLHPAADILPANWREFAHFGSVVSLTAGICEEIVFRGFIVTYLLVFTEGMEYATQITIVVSAFVFGIVHAYQGGLALIKITLLSMLFAWIFILTKSLILLIVLHFAIDFCSGLIAMLRKQEDEKLSRAWR